MKIVIREKTILSNIYMSCTENLEQEIISPHPTKKVFFAPQKAKKKEKLKEERRFGKIFKLEIQEGGGIKKRDFPLLF